MKGATSILLSVLVLSGAAQAPPRGAAPEAAREPLPVFRVDTTHSLPGFEVAHLGFTTVRGAFREWSGAIAYDAQDPTRSSVAILIDVASLDTGNATRDDDLRSANFFDVERYPLAFAGEITIARADFGVVNEGNILETNGLRTVTGEFLIAAARLVSRAASRERPSDCSSS